MRRLLLGACCFALLYGVVSGQPLQSPEEFLGFPVGADRSLADWEQMHQYFRELDRSPRVIVETIGTTTEENPFLLVTISAPENLEQRDKYRELQALLADPRKIIGSPETLIRQGKTIVLVTCSIHSTEVASAQMSMELAWDLAVSRDEETEEILRNVILLLVPSLNPDGINHVNHWYRQTLGTAAEGLPPPKLYHKYSGHDNNRDWYMFTQQETRLAVGSIHNRWHPQIVYDLHQMGSNGARIFVPPFVDPIDPNVDPILQAEIVDLGGFLFSALLAAGRQGVVTNAIYDAYAPSRAYQHYHGGVRILTESASARLATPIEIQVEELRKGLNYDPRQPSWNFPVVWEGGVWTLRDVVEDQKIAVRACLLHAARNRTRWLRNFYQVGLNGVQRRRPFAFLIPPETAQRDPEAVVDLLETLQFAAVEIHQSTESFAAKGVGTAPPWSESEKTDFPHGTYLVYMNQPYSAFAKTMLEIQEYPRLEVYPGGPLRQPYDVTAHTLGIQLGVAVYRVDQAFHVSDRRFEDARVRSVPTFLGEGGYWLLSHGNNASVKAVNRLLAAGYLAQWAPNGFLAEGQGFAVGTFLLRVGKDQQKAEALVTDLPLEIRRVSRRPQLAWQRIRLPRVALYVGHAPSMDEGWTRWILEQYEFPYVRLENTGLGKENLSAYDVIVIADKSADALKNGLSDPYPEEYRGGIGEDGMSRLRQYTESGGTLLFLGESTRLPIEAWDLGIEELTGALQSSEFFIPGSLLRAEVDNRHPIGYGVGPETSIMFVRSQAFAGKRGLSVVKYSGDSLRLSGWTHGEDKIVGTSALLEVSLEKGRVILVGFRTQFRAQMRATYKFLFNSLYYSTLRR